ncbi:unnamed protein product [Brachionus calyciflorus]|uniref:Uncharacterized protein n=1 Tax=Brachionus calyciflorus TaxID=104777 RepID=A0A813PUJ4_9BILA|nr:unnamed protein product [Brachionus calyciflorus]
MKYLGVILTDDNKNTEHISKYKRSALKAFNKVKKFSLLSNEVYPNKKEHLYNTFIRSILYYGLENPYLSKRERLTLKRIEGNLVKFMIGVPTRCKTTNLLCALKIKRLDALKCDFYLRIRKIIYTNELIDEVKQLENSLPNEMSHTTFFTN